MLAVIKNFNCLGDVACDRRNTKHVEVLNLICYVSCHLERVLRSDWHCWRSGEHLIGVYMTQSWANSLTVELMLFGKSLIYVRKSKEPSSVPLT